MRAWKRAPWRKGTWTKSQVCLWLHRLLNQNPSQRTEGPLSPGPVPSILTLHPHPDVPYNGCIPFGQPPNPHLQNSKG